MKLLYLILLFASCFTGTLIAQSTETVKPDDHKNEIGLANSPIYIVKEKEFAYGIHAHLVRRLKESNFGIGLGYERIFDDHKHNTVGIILSYAPVEHLSLGFSPGITFRDDASSGLNFGVHFETLYDFEIGIFHLGPVAELAYAVDDYHLSFGLHFGFGF